MFQNSAIDIEKLFKISHLALYVQPRRPRFILSLKR